ncbi:MAG: lysozyme inhibitor LprI family protein [Verrucomicrobiales bacterium]|nr:lysozyme inhibitor LprI family protein [Verrucomicrobiales bacterium]
MKKALILSGWILVLLSSPVKAESLAESQARYAEADDKLNEAYQGAKATLAEWRFSELQKDQREWVDYRDYRAKLAARFDGQAEEGKEEASPDYWMAMAYLTETRTDIVNAWTMIDDFTKDWEGVWIDGVGGELIISETKGEGVEFILTVVRGPTYHQGFIGGTVEVNGSMARFSDKGERSDDETWLTFHLEGGRLEVFGENTGYYHGARAYFDGTYIRVREVTDGDLKRLSGEEGY